MTTMRLKLVVRSTAIFGAIAGVLLPIQSIPSANALNVVQSVPAPFVNYYASSANVKNVVTSPNLPMKHDVAKSQFIINWNTISDDMKPAIQAAVDVWAANFPSSVPIKVDASLIRQSTYSGILASASSGKFFHGFKGAPDADLWYSSAQANALAGKDLDPNNAEIILFDLKDENIIA